MGLYDEIEPQDEGYEPTEEITKTILSSSKKKPKVKMPKFKFTIPPIVTKILLYILFAFVIVILIYAIYLAFKPDLIEYKLQPNPTYITGGKAKANLIVTITNTTDHTLENVMLKVEPIDNTSIAIVPSQGQTIPKIGSGEERKFSYQLSLLNGAPLGTYKIKITLETPFGPIIEEAKWEIKTYEME